MNYAQIENEIRQFIIQNPGTTTNRVAKYLCEKRLLSYVPAYKIILDLIDKGIIEDKKEGNSFHSLFINEKSNFNKIEMQLTKIGSIVNEMDRLIQRVDSNSFRDSRIAFEFVSEHYQYFQILLQIILVYTAENIQLDVYRQILYGKIIKLMVKMDRRLLREVREAYIGISDSRLSNRLKSYGNRKDQFGKSLNNLAALSKNLKNSIVALVG